ncbi:MAG: multidrug effflux MFS transporter [bacterium]|nr:multidrug effflux MFS transporter [bacterium]
MSITARAESQVSLSFGCAERSNSRAFMFLFLGALTAFGPFVTDMYLPALPAMTGYFNTTVSMVQLGLTFSMLGLALGQLGFGPFSDRLGRRVPLLASMLIYIFSTVLCIFAPSIEWFLFWRFWQGIAGAGGIVIARSIAVDTFVGQTLAQALAVIGAIMGVAPVLAPVIGGACADKIGWKGIFCILLALGFILLLLCLLFKESLPPERRSTQRWFAVFSMYKQVLQRKRFVFYVLQYAAANGILFGNVASSPFMVQEHYGCSALVFSVCFALNSLAIGVGAAMSMRFQRSQDCVKYSCAGMIVSSLAVALGMYWGCSLWLYETLITLACFTMGMTFTASTALALECVRDLAGTGAAVQGSSGYILGGLVAPLIGLGNIMLSTAAVFAGAALLSSIFAYCAHRSPACLTDA